MKKFWLMFALVAKGCHPSPVLAAEAKFVEEATYGDCKAGYLTWPINQNSWLKADRAVTIVICPGVANTSYSDGDDTHTAVVIKAPVETAQQKVSRLAKAKADALKKLTAEERKALGL